METPEPHLLCPLKFLDMLDVHGATHLAEICGTERSTTYRYAERARFLKHGMAVKPMQRGGKPPKIRFAPISGPVPGTKPTTALGLARLAFNRLGTRILFSRGYACWYIFKDHTYQQDISSDAVLAQLAVEETLSSDLTNVAGEIGLDRIISTLAGLCENSKEHTRLVDALDRVTISHLLPFPNGVYDRTTRVLRQGTPEDRLVGTAAIDFTPWHDLTEEDRAYALDFFERLFPEAHVRARAVHLIAESLFENREKRIMVWGYQFDSGKSTLRHAMQAAFGDLIAVIPTSALTKSTAISANAPTDWLFAVRHARVAIANEYKGEFLNVETLKQLSGPDPIPYKLSRAKHQLQSTFPVTITVLTNPKLRVRPKDDPDGAFISRICEVPCTQKFTRSGNAVDVPRLARVLPALLMRALEVDRDF